MSSSPDSFLHSRVRQLLFVDDAPNNSASSMSDDVASSWIDSSTQLWRIDALFGAAQHDFSAVGDASFQFYVDYARFVQRLANQCQRNSPAAAAAAAASRGVPMIDRLCALLNVTAALDNVCRALYCARYRVRVAPKKLREVLARFVGDSSDDENRAMFLLFRLLHHTCGALNSINFRNVIWHGFASAHEIDRLGAFAALLDALLLNLRHFGTIWIGCDSIAPPIHEPLAPLVFSGTTPTLSAVEFRALVSQAPLVHRASEQDRVYDGMFQLFRSNQRRDFAAVLFTTLEASLRVHYVRVNAAAFGSDMVEFQLDYDSLFISFAMLLNDTLFSKESADDGTGDYAYSFRSGDRNLLLERLPGDVLASLRELVFELELRDRLAHGLLQSDADISDDVMQAQWALLIALLQCRFEPLEVDALLARQHVPSFGVKRTLALALQRLERTESQMSFEAFYRALDTDALLVHECHGQLARICKNMCDARVLTDAAVANLPPDSSSNDGDSVAVPKHLALFRDAVHGAVYVRSAQLVRNWLSECEATRGNVASVRLARVEILSAQLLDCARRATWARFNLLAYHSGLLVRTQRERDLFGGIGRASVLRRDDERLVNLIQQD